jgi:hypothetical protein
MKLGVHDLRFVSLEDVVSHEWEDPARVERLRETLRREGILRNPPIVARAPTCYVVLDGTTRTRALRDLGCCDALVQVVDVTVPGFRLSTWHHMVSGMSAHSALEALHGLNIELIPLAPTEARAMLTHREISCYVIVKGVGAFGVREEPAAHDGIAKLNCIVDVYRSVADITRVPSSHGGVALDENPTAELLFAFPQFSHEEILGLAEAGNRIPAGITRFIIPERMLGINAELSLLGPELSLERKNQMLDAYLGECITQGKVRLYEEPVLIIEEKKLSMPLALANEEADHVNSTA